MSQHLHNKIGNAIGECKRRLFDRLKGGVDLNTALASFFAELTLALETIAREENVNPASVAN